MLQVPPIVEDEIQQLDDVRQRLSVLAPHESASEAETVAELERIRDEMRTAVTDDRPALEQQHEHLGRLLLQLRAGRDERRVDSGSPYFAHLRLERGGEITEVFLGKATCLDGGLRIVDWRHAPVARIFYRYAEGDLYEEQLGHREIEGRVVARRTVSISRARLERVSAPQGTWIREDEAWHHVPPRAPMPCDHNGAFVLHSAGTDQRLGIDAALRADKHLPDIAALIDCAQFEVMAHPDNGPLLLRGGAGSGKTTVALHRVAWLRHNNPGRFPAHRIMVVVFGKALRDYVSKVLPNLGVRGVTVTTWSDWARRLVGRHYPSLPNHENANTPSVVSRFKLHSALPLRLEQIIRSRKAPPAASSAIDDWKYLVSDRRLIGELGFDEAETEEIASWARSQQAQLAMHEERDRSAEPWLDEEDDAILLRAWQLRVGELKTKEGPVRLAHVAVDEAQDFSGMELAVLIGCLDKHRCLTLAGDTQQHIQEKGGTGDWATLLDALGITASTVSTLKVSYRSTRSITAFARSLLGNLAEADEEPLTVREGPPVELFPFSDHGACVDVLGRALRELLGRQPLASVAVLTPSEAVSKLYFAGLETMDVPSLRRVVAQTFSFTPGVDVVEVSQVKGLEFDYVILVDASDLSWPDRPATRRLLHVAATRAIHQLWITSVGPFSPVFGLNPEEGVDE